jgi:hypothetical protein
LLQVVKTDPSLAFSEYGFPIGEYTLKCPDVESNYDVFVYCYCNLIKSHTDNCVTEFRVERSIERRNFHSGRSRINSKEEELRWAVH